GASVVQRAFARGVFRGARGPKSISAQPMSAKPALSEANVTAKDLRIRSMWHVPRSLRSFAALRRLRMTGLYVQSRAVGLETSRFVRCLTKRVPDVFPERDENHALDRVVAREKRLHFAGRGARRVI